MVFLRLCFYLQSPPYVALVPIHYMMDCFNSALSLKVGRAFSLARILPAEAELPSPSLSLETMLRRRIFEAANLAPATVPNILVAEEHRAAALHWNAASYLY